MVRETLVSYQLTLTELQQAVKKFVEDNEVDEEIAHHVAGAQYCSLDWTVTPEGGLKDIWFSVDGTVKAKDKEL